LRWGCTCSHVRLKLPVSLGLRHPLHDPWVDLFGKIGAALLAMAFGTIIFWFLVLGGPSARDGARPPAVAQTRALHLVGAERSGP